MNNGINPNRQVYNPVNNGMNMGSTPVIVSESPAYANRKKSNPIGIIILLIIIAGVAGYYFLFNSSTNNMEIMSKLAGTWIANTQTEPAGDGWYIIPDITLTIYQDGTCFHSGKYKYGYLDSYPNTRITSGQGMNRKGKCEVNRMGNKFRITTPEGESRDSFFPEFVNFTLDGDTLTFYFITEGYITYTRVPDEITNSPLIGEWYLKNNGSVDPGTYYIFNVDSTINVRENRKSYSGTYEIEDDAFYIIIQTTSGDTYRQKKNYKIKDNTLIISDEGEEKTYIKN